MITNWQSIACMPTLKKDSYIHLGGCIAFLTEVIGIISPIHGIRIFTVDMEDKCWIDFQVDVNIDFFARNQKYIADQIRMFMIGFLKAFDLRYKNNLYSNAYWFNILNQDLKEKFKIDLYKTEDYCCFKKI